MRTHQSPDTVTGNLLQPAQARTHGTGFTLVELMVVVSIIAILIAILLPTFAGVRNQTRRVACAANLRNVGTAAHTYANAWGGYVPRGNDIIWFLAFMPYLSGDARPQYFWQVPIYLCPNYPEPSQRVCFVDSSWTFDSKQDLTGHEINAPTLLRGFSDPAKTIYLADNEWGYWRPIITGQENWSADRDRNDIWTSTHLPMSDSDDVTTGRRVARDRHYRGANVLYFDGGASLVKANEMTVEMWRDRK